MNEAKLPHPKVVLRAYDNDGLVVRATDIGLSDWYDGEVPLIDDPNECARLGVRSLEGQRSDQTGRITQRWVHTYNAAGQLVDTVAQDDWEPTRDNRTPPPKKGQSAADQIRQLGLFSWSDSHTKPSTND